MISPVNPSKFRQRYVIKRLDKFLSVDGSLVSLQDEALLFVDPDVAGKNLRQFILLQKSRDEIEKEVKNWSIDSVLVPHLSL